MSRTEQVLQAFRRTRRGLLAFDEQLVVLRRPGKLPSIVTSSDLRRVFYETCIAAPGLSAWIGGICLFEETLRQRAASGVTLPALIGERGMTVGVRIDTGSVPFASGGLVTDGVDNLAIRLNRTASYGAQFATWHMALRSDAQIGGSAHAFAEDCARAARFVAAAHGSDLLPLLAVEPEPGHSADAAGHRVFFRELVSVLNQSDPTLAEVALQVRLRPVTDRGGHAHRAALLQDVRAELPNSLGILFLGTDDADQCVQAMKGLGDPADLAWPIRHTLGSGTQTRLLANWQDTGAVQATIEHILLEQVHAASAAMIGTKIADS